MSVQAEARRAGIPTIAIFQSTDPAIWGARGQHVRILQQPAPAVVIDVLHAFGIY